MTTINGSINESNYLNNKQLIQIRNNLSGVSKSSNASIFNTVSSLDMNKNETLESGETAISFLINLGNAILNKLAAIFGIDVSDPQENSPMNNFEEVQQDSVIKDYFEPFHNEAKEATSEKLQEGKLYNMIDKNTLQYTISAIKQEKLSQGVKIVSEDENSTVFDDGTEISYNQSGGSYNLTYMRTAADGSYVAGTINANNTEDSQVFDIFTHFNDGKGDINAINSADNGTTIGQQTYFQGSETNLDGHIQKEQFLSHFSSALKPNTISVDGVIRSIGSDT